MGRSHRHVPDRARAKRYVVVWNLHWQVLDCRELDPDVDPREALAAAIRQWVLEGWSAESAGDFGFVFVRREGERRLLAVTARDPFSTIAQSFSPFSAQAP